MNVDTPFFSFILFLALRRISNRLAGQVIQRMCTNDCTLDTLLALKNIYLRAGYDSLCHIVHEEMTNFYIVV